MSILNLKNNPIFIVVTLIVATIFFLVLGFLRPADLPKRTSYWVNPPDIFICDVANVEKSQVIEAVEFWEGLGFEFGNIIDDYDCVYNDDEDYRNIFLPDTIIIYPAYKKLKEGKSGVSIRSVDKKTQENYSVVIEIMFFNKRTIKHELGHSLGWEDTNRPGHIMYPKPGGGNMNESEGLSPDVELSPLDI